MNFFSSILWGDRPSPDLQSPMGLLGAARTPLWFTSSARSIVFSDVIANSINFISVLQGFKKETQLLTDPFTVLYILFTHPDYQRCGAGSIHVKWGTDLADRLLVPCWVEASPFGHHLYEENGFRDVEQVCTRTKKWVGEYTMMRRAPKTRLDAGRTVILNGH